MANIYRPSLESVERIILQSHHNKNAPNLVPIFRESSSTSLNISDAYLRLTSSYESKFSFLFESAVNEKKGRYVFMGTSPHKILKTGEGHGESVDPLPGLESELKKRRIAQVPGLILPPLTGGAIGYVGYDCVKYFEPKTSRPLVDVLKVPESLFMFFDTVVAFDRMTDFVKVITYLHVPDDISELSTAYQTAQKNIDNVHDVILASNKIVLQQGTPKQSGDFISNIGQKGYEGHVAALKSHIINGNIIQAVPSQRIAYPSSLHPFNIYQALRKVNPSPYLFYIDCHEFQIVGASPELLVKKEAGRILTHPIAGTIKRSHDKEEDKRLGEQLQRSTKDVAEHVMLVDLARNDINRVCDPLSTRVDRLMTVEKFSHVQHLVSQVSGILRENKTRFDAFRSIFPAGTVSGAPKVKAMELIAELEGEKRGVYAGAVGYFGYNTVDAYEKENEGEMDTCIALRTMVVKDGVVYLQAGGGIVFDSDPTEEFEETMNKALASITAIKKAEHLNSCQDHSDQGKSCI
ncbi:Anthranilate synthase component 1 [Erysiphe neolycopersici]|uniref:Anthranilate synthase component 1 n=1 Tax=Erysiphe neolycopersici TaxID=212602 RepID=A0A420HGS7_9PEZI|nr:Anthranilate synthase component 1 [Erysiphe neolycopersici]